MRLSTTGPKSSGRRIIIVAAGLCLLSTCLPSASAFSLGGSKKVDFQLPTNAKLDLGTLPVEESSSDSGSDASLDLSPLSLDGGQKPADKSRPVKSKKGVLNASVTETNYVPKGPMEGKNRLLAPTSVKGSKVTKVDNLGGSIMEQAQSVNAAPLPLVETASESESKLDEQRELERQQLTALWEATLTRSPDINFVLQKLLPSSDHSKVTTVLMRTLSTAMFGALGTMSMIAPGPGTYMTQNIGVSTINQLLSIQESKNQKKARLTQTEAIMLFQMIRDTADKLVLAYRDYKSQHKHVYKTNSDFEDLKNMVSAAQDKSAAEQLEMVYTLRKAQRELDKEGAELNKFRQVLVDLAGQDAVVKLDGDIDQEFRQLHPELFLNIASSTKEKESKPLETVKKNKKPKKQATKLAAGKSIKGKLTANKSKSDNNGLATTKTNPML